ncbi:DUF2786 domain-containing protein [Catenuloplanes sp. NPDC051500]|uniref:DUF2786 domain-containing protein n=1 Tax=Catenuloplanes sp. NPDC051500 TaxID=3363959 RepID=UPI0037AC0850
MTDQTRLAKIRALLAKAEATTFEAERDAYNAKAAELISAWGLEDALREAEAQTPLQVSDKFIKVTGAYQKDKAILAYQVAEGLGLKAVLHQSGTGKGKGYATHIFGSSEDFVRVELLFTSLLVQASYGLSVARPYSPFEDVKAYRRSWLAGFTSAIRGRLDAARQQGIREQSTGTPGTALVLVDRSKAIQRAVDAYYPKLVTSTRRLTGSGRNAGYAAGQRANLGGNEVAQRGRPAGALTR